MQSPGKAGRREARPRGYPGCRHNDVMILTDVTAANPFNTPTGTAIKQ
jgi:hypothetical protein